MLHFTAPERLRNKKWSKRGEYAWTSLGRRKKRDLLVGSEADEMGTGGICCGVSGGEQ